MCVWTVRLFILAYLIALALLIIGTYGLFGQAADPLSGIFLIPLGLPWNLFTGAAPEAAKFWLGATAPILNILILRWLCNRFGTR